MTPTEISHVERQAESGSRPVVPGTASVPQQPRIDRLVERGTRAMYEGLPRRGFLTTLGKLALIATGVQVAPLLPIDRTTPTASANHDCNTWYYCNSNAPRLCSCCVGGSDCMCPAGTYTTSGGLWWGCCYNPSAGRYYWVGMWDCCYNDISQVQCGNPNCRCVNSSEPNWCLSGFYYCTSACIESQTCA